MYIFDTIKENNRIKGYIVIDEFSRRKAVSKEAVINAIKSGRCLNGRIQTYNGSIIVRYKPFSEIQKDTVYKDSSAGIMSGKSATDVLDTLEIGIPLKVKTSIDSEFKQAIYVGKGEVQGRLAYRFFDGCGVDGVFALSKQFIHNNTDKIQFDFEHNEPKKVKELRCRMK